MKKIILLLVSLSTVNVYAVCQNTDRIFMAEGDDEGTTLKLAYTCQAEGDEICLYTNSTVASVQGSMKKKYVSSSELYRRKYLSEQSSIEISLKTSLLESLLDYKAIKVELNKQTLKGTIQLEGKGVDPYSGSSYSSIKSKLSCEKAY